MKLTIIPADGAVGADGKFYLELNLNDCGIPDNIHALQWDGAAGWLEFKDTAPNEEIIVLPDWAKSCIAKWTEANTPKPPPPPTAEENKIAAMSKLQATDWTTIPDVSDPTKSNPYLSNVQDFIAYRNAVRQYAINPVAGEINWAVLPQEVWTTV